METSDQGILADTKSQRPRKKMRKGTRSCTECRRRKARCIFPPDSPVCTFCSARNVKCVDQRDDVGNGDKVERRTRPRPIISSGSRETRAQASSASSLHLEDSVGISEGRSFDIETLSEYQPPLVSILDNAEETSQPQDGSSMAAASSVARKAKVCETLRAALPKYDDITLTLIKNGAWWDSFRQKTRAISQAELVEPLLSFAAHAYTSTSPAELAILAVAYARSLGRSHHLFSLVDSLIISDFSFTASLDGMECLILLAKTYTDIGQPRRAWFTWRKGLSIAQMMGLHRVSLDGPPIRQRIWWAIYHGDRFTSLLLGLPHGFNDAYFGPSKLNTLSSEPLEIWLPQFIHECAVMAGQVIDYITAPQKPSFSKAMSMDETMDLLSKSAPIGWWDIPTTLPTSQAELAHLVERLLVQFFFFHVRMYIHLPLLKASSTSPSQQVNRLACAEAARQMVKRFLVLSSDVNGASLFDCKTSDFVSFTAAVVLLIGHSSPSEYRSVPGYEDLQLVSDAERIFERRERETGCKIAAQCRKALSLISGLARDGGPQEVQVPIPYFGSVVRRRATDAPNGQLDTPSSQPTPSYVAASSAFDMQNTWMSDYSLEYMGYNVQDFAMSDILGGDGTFDNSLMPMGMDISCLDIDQDWSLFAPYMNI